MLHFDGPTPYEGGGMHACSRVSMFVPVVEMSPKGWRTADMLSVSRIELPSFSISGPQPMFGLHGWGYIVGGAGRMPNVAYQTNLCASSFK